MLEIKMKVIYLIVGIFMTLFLLNEVFAFNIVNIPTCTCPTPGGYTSSYMGCTIPPEVLKDACSINGYQSNYTNGLNPNLPYLAVIAILIIIIIAILLIKIRRK